MPQADLVTFSSTFLLLPVAFLLGYFFFVTHWVPRILTTLKARHWLLHVRRAVLVGGLAPVQGWPELFLLFVQFAGLIWFLSTLTLIVSDGVTLAPLVYVPPSRVTYELVGGAAVENFFYLWSVHRGDFLYTASAVGLNAVVHTVLGQSVFSALPKQFPLLRLKLKHQLPSPGDFVG